MNNYQRAVEEIPHIKSAIENINYACQKDKNGNRDSSNDKGRIDFTTGGHNKYNSPEIQTTDGWNRAVIYVSAIHGYYGNSSCHENMNELVAQYIIRALRDLSKSIGQKAVEIAQKDIEELRQKAKNEAEMVIGELERSDSEASDG